MCACIRRNISLPLFSNNHFLTHFDFSPLKLILFNFFPEGKGTNEGNKVSTNQSGTCFFFYIQAPRPRFLQLNEGSEGSAHVVKPVAFRRWKMDSFSSARGLSPPPPSPGFVICELPITKTQGTTLLCWKICIFHSNLHRNWAASVSIYLLSNMFGTTSLCLIFSPQT